MSETTRMRVRVRESGDELRVSRGCSGDLLMVAVGLSGTDHHDAVRRQVFLEIPASSARAVVRGMASIVGLQVPGGHFDEEIRDAFEFVIATSKHDVTRFIQARDLLFAPDTDTDEAGEVSA